MDLINVMWPTNQFTQTKYVLTRAMKEGRKLWHGPKEAKVASFAFSSDLILFSHVVSDLGLR